MYFVSRKLNFDPLILEMTLKTNSRSKLTHAIKGLDHMLLLCKYQISLKFMIYGHLIEYNGKIQL